jgi:hypothetical protein
MAGQEFQFDADLLRFSELLNITIEKVIQRVTFELYTDITTGWPVKTGYSRANWRIGVGEPDLTTLPLPPDQTPNQYPPPTIDFEQLSQIDGKQPVFITNNVDYALFLEEGSSTQAPSGVVQISVQKLEQHMNDIIAGASSASQNQ